MTAPIPPDVVSQLRNLIRREIQAVMSSAPTRNMSSGPLEIRDGQVSMNYPAETGGEKAVYFGPLWNSISGNYAGTGFTVSSQDGTNILNAYYSEEFGRPLLQMYDAASNVVFATDAGSGQGVARPFIPGAFYRARYDDWSVRTTAAEFETLWATRMLKQQPRLQVGVRASMDTTATTGELRVLVNGTPLGAAQDVGFGLGFFTFGPAAVAGAHMASLDVEIQARRTSAAGAMRVEPWHAPFGRQS